jgi:replicative DNA helicase
MKNITVSVNDEIYRRARRKAAERNTSVSRLVADYLRLLGKEEELRAERTKRLKELFASQDKKRLKKGVGRFKREEIYGRGIR